MSFARKRMELKDIMLSEINDTERQIQCILFCIWELKTKQNMIIAFKCSLISLGYCLPVSPCYSCPIRTAPWFYEYRLWCSAMQDIWQFREPQHVCLLSPTVPQTFQGAWWNVYQLNEVGHLVYLQALWKDSGLGDLGETKALWPGKCEAPSVLRGPFVLEHISQFASILDSKLLCGTERFHKHIWILSGMSLTWEGAVPWLLPPPSFSSLVSPLPPLWRWCFSSFNP